jgi:antitoxin ParD1/3/4
MDVRLTPEMEKLVNEKIKSGFYSDVASVISDALQLLDERDRVEARVEALLQEAEDSGEGTEMTQEDWTDIQSEALARVKLRKSS